MRKGTTGVCVGQGWPPAWFSVAACCSVQQWVVGVAFALTYLP